MRCLGLTVVFLVCSAWGNEDVLRDYISNIVNGNQYERRAVLNAFSSAAVVDAAKNWVGNVGWGKTLNSAVSQSFEDACLGLNDPVNNISPWGGNSITNNLSPWGGSSIISNNNNWNSIGKREEEGRLSNRDIVFVLDSSGSISQDQFDKAKKAITVLIEAFCPTTMGNEVTDAGTKQISVVLFDSRVTTEVDFSESSKGVGYLQDKILSIKHRKGSTATGSALAYVRSNVLGKGSSRLNDPKVSTDVIVITDGQCNQNCRILGREANAIRTMGHGVNLSAMGVGNARACELEIITGKGSSDMAYGLGDFRNFDRFATAVKEIAEENESKCA